MTAKILPCSGSKEPPPRTINPRAPNRTLPPKIIEHAISIEPIATLLEVGQYTLFFKSLHDQRLAIQGHIDRLIDEFDEDMEAYKTENDATKLAELNYRITSAFRRGYLDFCEFRRVERIIGMLPSDRFAKYLSRL